MVDYLGQKTEDGRSCVLHRHQLIQVMFFERPCVNDLTAVSIDDTDELTFLQMQCFALTSWDRHQIRANGHSLQRLLLGGQSGTSIT